MRYQLKRTQQLNCSIDTAWEFFCSPHNLTRITPPDMRFEVLSDLPSGAIYPGLEIKYHVSPLMRIPLRWTTKITEVDEGKSFTDFQLKGPYKYWNHRHDFTPNADGVLMQDTVDYELPFGLLGTWAHWLFVRRKLETIFDYRFRILEELFANNKIKK